MCDDSLSFSSRLMPESCPPTREPSFHRFRIGKMMVTALCDGHFPLSAHDVLRSNEVSLDTLLMEARLGDVVSSHVNAFLIDDGLHRILIDAGAGDLQDATLGQMAAQMMSAGHRPSDIDIVLVTHLHPDHIGGLTRNGEALFPRAVVHVPREEAAFWLETSDCDNVDPSVRGAFEQASQILAPYVADGRCCLFDPEMSWYGCLTAESLRGHTCGHTGYRLRTGGAGSRFLWRPVPCRPSATGRTERDRLLRQPANASKNDERDLSGRGVRAWRRRSCGSRTVSRARTYPQGRAGIRMASRSMILAGCLVEHFFWECLAPLMAASAVESCHPMRW